MDSLIATAARQAAARAAECRQRADRLANDRRVGPEDVRRAQVALRQAIVRAAKAHDRYTRRSSDRSAGLTRFRSEDVATVVSPQSPLSAQAPTCDAAVLRRRSERLDRADLFLTYFSLGGHCTEFELDAFVHSALELPTSELTILAHALWEMTEF